MRVSFSKLMNGARLKRMFVQVTLVTLGVVGAGQSLRAQNGPTEPRCESTTTAADACNKLFDMFRLISPQIGVALGGGNSMPGENGTLGGPSKYSLALRVSAIDGIVPKNFDAVSGPAAPSSNLGAQRAPIPMISGDIATGVFQGFAYGLTNVFGVDLLLGLTYVPSINKDAVKLDPSGLGVKASYGVRLGLLQESAAVPGVSISYRDRALPNSAITFASSNDTLRVKGASVDTRSLRIVAGKHYKFIGVSGGYGRDQVRARSLFEAVVHDGASSISSALPAAEYNVTRSNAFASVSLGLPRAQLVGEIGWSGAGDAHETRNTFDGNNVNAKYRYYTFGLSFRP
ncbi:MAG: hypothetical protein ABJB74_01620 [Gemmatimonas sp.]